VGFGVKLADLVHNELITLHLGLLFDPLVVEGSQPLKFF